MSATAEASPSIRSFIGGLRAHWLDAMSGAASVPFAFAAAYTPNKYTQIIFAVMAISLAWFASYRVWKAERQKLIELQAKYQALVDEYPHSIRLENLNTEEDRKLDAQTQKPVERVARFVLLWRNAISRPVSYKMIKMSIDGSPLTFRETTNVISGNSTAMYYTAYFPIDLPIGSYGKRLSLEMTYGVPDGPPSRRVNKTMDIVSNPESGRTTFLYAEDSDVPIPEGTH